MELPARDVDDARRHDRRGDDQGNEPDRQDEEHRDEDELGRDDAPDPDLEVEAERERVGADEQQDGERETERLDGKQEGQRDDDGEKQAVRDRERDALAGRELAQAPGPSLLDRALDLEIEGGIGPFRKGRRSRHVQMIGARRRLLCRAHSIEGSRAAPPYPSG